MGSADALRDLELVEPEGEEPEGDEEVDERSVRRASFANRLEAALEALGSNSEAGLEDQARQLGPATWIAEFEEHGLGGDIRTALEHVQAWLATSNPAGETAQILYDRSPNILLFSDDHRLLASSYELTDETVETPPAALGNISAMAGLSLHELWKMINNGDEGARETLIEKANQTLQTKFAQIWNQSNISAHLKINGASLEIRIKSASRQACSGWGLGDADNP